MHRPTTRSKLTTLTTVQPDGEFNGELEIDFDEFLDNTAVFDGFNNAVDFQALVRDLAGNVGFSDSDPHRSALHQRTRRRGRRTTAILTDRDKHNVIGVLLTPRCLHRRDRPIHRNGCLGYRFLRS